MCCFDGSLILITIFLFLQMTYSYYNLRLLLIDLFPYDAAEGSTQVDIERNSTLERYQSSESSVDTLPNSTPPKSSTSGHNDSSTCPMCYEEYTNGAEIRRYHVKATSICFILINYLPRYENCIIIDQKTVHGNRILSHFKYNHSQHANITTDKSYSGFFSTRLY